MDCTVMAKYYCLTEIRNFVGIFLITLKCDFHQKMVCFFFSHSISEMLCVFLMRGKNRLEHFSERRTYTEESAQSEENNIHDCEKCEKGQVLKKKKSSSSFRGIGLSSPEMFRLLCRIWQTALFEYGSKTTENGECVLSSIFLFIDLEIEENCKLITIQNKLLQILRNYNQDWYIEEET